MTWECAIPGKKGVSVILHFCFVWIIVYVNIKFLTSMVTKYLNFRHHGKEDYTNCEWFSRMTILQVPLNVNLNLPYFTPMSILRELFAYLCLMKRKTGAQQSQSNKSYLVYRICSMNLMLKIQLKRKHTQSIGKHKYFITFAWNVSKWIKRNMLPVLWKPQHSWNATSPYNKQSKVDLSKIISYKIGLPFDAIIEKIIERTGLGRGLGCSYG